MIGIIDYGMGNLRSVQKAFERCGAQAVMVADAAGVADVDKLVLPGVGAFADGMLHLDQRGLIEPIQSSVGAGKPLLGICLGMQLLFDGGEEDAPANELIPGLGLVPGKVVALTGEAYGAGRLKVPHMGWNALHFPHGPTGLFEGIGEGEAVYFVHGYHAQPRDARVMAAVTDYGQPVCAAIAVDNLWATQFHPEKSQRVGLRMLQNFANL